MAVYDNRRRTDPAPKREMESSADFFNRISGPFWDQIRDVVNEWWAHFPDHVRPGLMSRLVDRNSDANVHSALWELYLHEMLIGSGCTVQIEQQVGARGKYPDFLVTYGETQFVLEAIWTAQRVGGGEPGRMPPQLVDAIDRVPSPNFFVAYQLDVAGLATPPQRKLKAELAKWLDGLDPDRVVAARERGVPLPRHVWQESGWRVTFDAIPRSPDRRGDPTARTIGVHASVWLDEDLNLVLEAVRRKGGKYGEMNLPFIVAVGNEVVFPEDSETEAALYGALNGRASGRASGGYWGVPEGHPHSRVSGVLVVDNPGPWNWARRTPVLWRSPHPESMPAPVLPTWEAASLVGTEVARVPAESPVSSALELPDHWPVGAPFPRS
ncbi:hypothetical protein [Kitasatospora sp. NPDC059673]|uniref:hypothetical protein n=1 Tax=Kitasatospora sp. NPDC059673 TaxID=3346901 RepID=UPI0036AE7B3C